MDDMDLRNGIKGKNVRRMGQAQSSTTRAPHQEETPGEKRKDSRFLEVHESYLDKDILLGTKDCSASKRGQTKADSTNLVSSIG